MWPGWARYAKCRIPSCVLSHEQSQKTPFFIAKKILWKRCCWTHELPSSSWWMRNQSWYNNNIRVQKKQAQEAAQKLWQNPAHVHVNTQHWQPTNSDTLAIQQRFTLGMKLQVKAYKILTRFHVFSLIVNYSMMDFNVLYVCVFISFWNSKCGFSGELIPPGSLVSKQCKWWKNKCQTLIMTQCTTCVFFRPRSFIILPHSTWDESNWRCRLEYVTHLGTDMQRCKCYMYLLCTDKSFR